MEQLYVCWMGKKTAEAWTRKIYNVKPEHELGWTPYRIIITKDAMSHTAFVRAAEFRRWLDGRKVQLTHNSIGTTKGWRHFDSMRVGTIQGGEVK